MFLSRIEPSYSEDDIRQYIAEEVDPKQLEIIRLKTKWDSYASFYIGAPEHIYELINEPEFWPTGCLIATFYGKPRRDQQFCPGGEGAEDPLS